MAGRLAVMSVAVTVALTAGLSAVLKAEQRETAMVVVTAGMTGALMAGTWDDKMVGCLAVAWVGELDTETAGKRAAMKAVLMGSLLATSKDRPTAAKRVALMAPKKVVLWVVMMAVMKVATKVVWRAGWSAGRSDVLTAVMKAVMKA